jgi:hypothetical protein
MTQRIRVRSEIVLALELKLPVVPDLVAGAVSWQSNLAHRPSGFPPGVPGPPYTIYRRQRRRQPRSCEVPPVNPEAAQIPRQQMLARPCCWKWWEPGASALSGKGVKFPTCC